jgi:phage shock protein E
MSKYLNMNIDKQATIVDVRTPGEFAVQHFPGAINIPLNDVLKKMKQFRNMSKPIVVYCRSGNRSGLAVTILQQNGISSVINGGSLESLLNQNQS